MSTTEADQCVAADGLSVATNGTPASFNYGDILPPVVTQADVQARAALRGGGEIRAVTVCTTPTDFTAACYAAAQVIAQAEATSTGAALAKPVLVCDENLPIVAEY
jgi:hypothetical protein